MRFSLTLLCLALALAGCRSPSGGLLGQITIPPPGTQPPGSLLAGNGYYPDNAFPRDSATAPVLPPAAVTPVPPPLSPPSSSLAQPNLPPNLLPASPPGFTPVADRRGAGISRSNLAAPSRTAAAPAGREEPIRIPESPTGLGALAAIVPIQGMPTTDATGLFQAVRSQIQPAANLASRSTTPNGFVEISQLPDAPAAVRRKAAGNTLQR